MKLTHLDEKGNARMVDITDKRKTDRAAKAWGKVKMSRAAYLAVKKGNGPKGDVLTTAKIAGIQGAKKAHELIPLCHPLAIGAIDIAFRFVDRRSELEITCSVKGRDQTGFEMEALTGVMLAALTVYDMCKALDKSIELGPFYLLEKSGGKSGKYLRRRA